MSAIDLYRHELCGQLAGLPLYHLQERSDAARCDFEAGPEHLLLGGGSGEHPAAVVDVRVAVSWLASEYLDVLERGAEGELLTGREGWAYETATNLGVTGEVLLALDGDLMGDGSTPYGDYSAWTGDLWAGVVKRAKKWPHGAAYRPSRHQSIESWLTLSAAEFTTVSYPDLILTHPAVSADSHPAFAQLRDLALNAPLFATVVQVTRGYPAGGRGDSLSDANVRW